MSGFLSSILNLFGSDSDSPETVDPDIVLNGTASRSGVVSICEDLGDWRESYAEEFDDFLTVQEALEKYDKITEARERLEPILEHEAEYDSDVVDAAQTLDSRLKEIADFIEARSEYNDEWLDEMEERYGEELNSYFDDPDFTHTKQQFRAIFANDNFNRVNAAAGTGKTTTFGRRVHFILSGFVEILFFRHKIV